MTQQARAGTVTCPCRFCVDFGRTLLGPAPGVGCDGRSARSAIEQSPRRTRRSDCDDERPPVAHAEQRLVELAQERRTIAVLERLDERTPGGIGDGRRACLPAGERRSARRGAPTAQPARPRAGRPRAAATSRREARRTRRAAARSGTARSGTATAPSGRAPRRARCRRRRARAGGAARPRAPRGTSRAGSPRPEAASPRSAARAGSRTGGRRASRTGPDRRRAARRSRAGSR